MKNNEIIVNFKNSDKRIFVDTVFLNKNEINFIQFDDELFDIYFVKEDILKIKKKSQNNIQSGCITVGGYSIWKQEIY